MRSAFVPLDAEPGKARFRILTRVSDDKLRSIPQQAKDCMEYAAAHGAAVDGIYNLGEHSGFSMTENAVYRQLLEDAKEGRFDGLVVRDTSRLGRDYWEKLGTLRDLRAAKVEFHVVEDGGKFDFDDRLQKVKSWASTWADEEKKKEEIRKSIRATDAIRDMKFPTTKPPFGYDTARDAKMGRRVWKQNKDADKVRVIFQRAAANPNLNRMALARELGLVEYQVGRIIQNRAYTGGFSWKGAFTKCDPAIVPPIVDDTTFGLAQRDSKTKPS